MVCQWRLCSIPLHIIVLPYYKGRFESTLVSGMTYIHYLSFSYIGLGATCFWELSGKLSWLALENCERLHFLYWEGGWWINPWSGKMSSSAVPPAGERGSPGAVGLSSRQSRANAQDRFRKILLAILYYITRIVKLLVFNRTFFLYTCGNQKSFSVNNLKYTLLERFSIPKILFLYYFLVEKSKFQ